VGAWIGLTVAAFCAAVEFGIQPALFHTADGAPLYAPYPLSVSIPAMVIPHLLVASVVEGLVTVAVVAFLQRSNQSALEMAGQKTFSGEQGGFGRWRGVWIGLIVLMLISPIGLLAPGTAWGEWGAEELTGMGLSSIPQGLAKLSTLWNAPLPDYDLPSMGNTTVAYVLSAVVGILITCLVVWLFSLLVIGKKPDHTPVTGSGTQNS
jgi:cobalt/nickel transport system permease protein